jgi:glycerol-3-phosphate O-acyltransferase
MDDPAHPVHDGNGPESGRCLNRILGGTRHHYRCVLPESPGALTFQLLKLFYSGVRLEEAQAEALRGLPPEAVLVFAAKFSGLFSFLFAYTRHRGAGLRPPRIGLGCRTWLWQPAAKRLRIVLAQAEHLLRHRRLPDPFANGHLREQLLAGAPGFMALIPRKRLSARLGKKPVDPLEFLIELQKQIERPVLIVPQLFFFSKKPQRLQPTLMDLAFGPQDEPGRLRRLVTLFKHPGRVFVEISPPVSIREFLERTEIRDQPSAYQAALLQGHVLEQINRHRQSITGPVLISRQELQESILNSEPLQRFMQQHADAQGSSVYEVRSKARHYLEEIAADIKPNWILLYSAIIGWILSTLFDGVSVNPDAFAALKRLALRGPLVFIPSHKSHVDYLILSYMLYHHDLPCPLIAAGKNLSFWPLGPLFRRGGAFFIRRSFKGAVLYAQAFAAYIHQILAEGHNVEQFIEGGRSRTGKLLKPKLGLLSILLNACKNGACSDLIFVPVSIGYDQVLEEKSYLHEIEGGQKTSENLKQVLNASKFLKKRYGKVYLQFSDTISLAEFNAPAGKPLAALAAQEMGELCQRLAQRIACAIDRVSVVTPHALTAAAILNSGRERLSFEELLEIAEVFVNHLDKVTARLADTLILDHRRAVSHALDSYVQRKILETVAASSAGGAGYILKANKRPTLDYYRNTCVAFFVPAAFTALAVLQKDAFQFSAADLHTDYEFFQDLLQREFVFDTDMPAAYHVRKGLKAFVDDAVLIPHQSLPDTYNLTATGYRTLKLFAMFLKPLLESYWIVLSYIRQAPPDELHAKERGKKAAAWGERLLREKKIETREALSKISYENALAFFLDAHGPEASRAERLDTCAAGLARALRIVRT